MRYFPGRLLSSPRTTKTRRWASNRGDDEEWIDHLGDRAWINWARAVVQQDPAKIAMIKAVTSMLAGLSAARRGH